MGLSVLGYILSYISSYIFYLKSPSKFIIIVVTYKSTKSMQVTENLKGTISSQSLGHTCGHSGLALDIVNWGDDDDV